MDRNKVRQSLHSLFVSFETRFKDITPQHSRDYMLQNKLKRQSRKIINIKIEPAIILF